MEAVDVETGANSQSVQSRNIVHLDDIVAPISIVKTPSSANVFGTSESPSAPAPVKRGNRRSIMQMTGIANIFSGSSAPEDEKEKEPITNIPRRPTDLRILSAYFSLGSEDNNEADKVPEQPISAQIMNDGRFSGLFPDWGTTRIVSVRYQEGHCVAIADTDESSGKLEDKNKLALENRDKYGEHAEVKLTLLPSVSIAGCDLLSSCLYTAGTCASYAGKLAPVGLVMVTVMLMFFRHVYSEVISCIPINGGTYNSMLNTTSKKAASVAGLLSILAYVATAIISAYDAIVYLQLLWPQADERAGTIIIVALFCALTLYGVKESSIVSTMLLILHLTSLLLLIFWGFAFGCQDGFQVFRENTRSPLLTIRDESDKILSSGNLKILGAIFYGYSSALLGITGFESAANYVESLKSTRTFVKTVNWLWFLVGFFNPALSIVSMMVLPLQEIYDNPSDLLAVMGHRLGGRRLEQLIAVDAVLVLCGAVLTSFVGVSGLMVRLANDKVIPKFISYQTANGSPVAASLLFLAITLSLFLFLYKPGDSRQITNFGGVYAIAFLCVLIMFASSAIMLKLYRSNMARLVIARWWEIILSLVAVTAGLIGNITLTPTVFVLFIIYFVIFAAACAYMFLRVDIFSFFIWMLRKSIITVESQSTGKDIEKLIVQAASTQKQFKEYHEELSEEFKEDEPAPQATHDHEKHSSIEDGVIAVIRRTSNSVLDVSAALSRRKRSGSASSEAEMTGTSTSASQKEKEKEKSPTQLVLALSLLTGIKRRLSSTSLSLDSGERRQKKELLELDAVMAHNRILGSMLRYFMVALDNILKEPFVYLCKVPDPIVLRLAMEYINDNELTNNILLVHFVDDREVMKSHKKFMHGIKQEIKLGNIPAHQEDQYSRAFLIQSTVIHNEDNEKVADLATFLAVDGEHIQLNGAIEKLPSSAKSLSSAAHLFDSYYNKKKVSCMVVRGTYFCPSAVEWLSCYLNIPSNNMIMGTPSENFAFPVGALHGIRIALPEPMRISRDNASGSVFNAQEGLKYMRF